MGDLPILLCNQHQSFVYISKDKWIFLYTLGFNPTLLYLFCFSMCSSFEHWEIFRLALLSLCCTSVIVCVRACVCFTYVLSFWHYKMIQAHLVYFLPSTRISHSSHSSYWIMVLKIKFWAQCRVIVTRISLLLGPLS